MPVMSAIESRFCRSAPWRSFARRVVLPWALNGLEPHGQLLELGGGSGAMAEATAREYPVLQLTVTDIDPAMVRTAQRRLSGRPNVTVTEADMTDLPFEDGAFDLVVTYLMLHHVIEWSAALTESARVLRPGGILLGYDLTDTRLAQLVHWADRSPHKLITPVDLGRALEGVGFDHVHVDLGLGRHVMRFAAHLPRTP